MPTPALAMTYGDEEGDNGGGGGDGGGDVSWRPKSSTNAAITAMAKARAVLPAYLMQTPEQVLQRHVVAVSQQRDIDAQRRAFRVRDDAAVAAAAQRGARVGSAGGAGSSSRNGGRRNIDALLSSDSRGCDPGSRQSSTSLGRSGDGGSVSGMGVAEGGAPELKDLLSAADEDNGSLCGSMSSEVGPPDPPRPPSYSGVPT